MQAKNGFCPVTTLSDRGTRKASAQQDAKSFFHHKPSHHTWQSDAFSHHNTDCGLDFCPNPLCSGVQGVGATTLPMSCFLAGKGTHSQEVHLLYASKKIPPLTQKPSFALCSGSESCPSTAHPSCSPAAAREVGAHFPVTGLSRCEMLHIAARPRALTRGLEEAPEISLVGRKNIL